MGDAEHKGGVRRNFCCPLGEFSPSPQSRFRAAVLHGGVQSQDSRGQVHFQGRPLEQTPAPGLQAGHAREEKGKEGAAMTASARVCCSAALQTASGNR